MDRKIVDPNDHLTPESLVPRLGDYLVKNGKITEQQLSQALLYQRESLVKGQVIKLGQALLRLGFIDEQTLDQTIAIQIIDLHSALKQSNEELEKCITERTKELNQALDRLMELNQYKANFFANISPELKTPLTTIKSTLEILAQDKLGDLSPVQKSALNKIEQAESKLEKMIDKLIAYTNAERADSQLEIASTQLDKIVELCLQNAQIPAKEAAIRLHSKLPVEIPEVYCDLKKIVWVVEELIGNAIKFTPQGGGVWVEVYQKNDRMVVAVSDNGVGVPSEQQMEIFEPFHPLHKPSIQRNRGSGLGLALAKRIIEAHGSKLRMQSTLNEGTRFEFSLPTSENLGSPEA